jgi:hypothetical protein
LTVTGEPTCEVELSGAFSVNVIVPVPLKLPDKVAESQVVPVPTTPPPVVVALVSIDGDALMIVKHSVSLFV